MKETKKENKKAGKRNYSKPVLTAIDLAADEVLSTNCKTMSNVGVVSTGPCFTYSFSPCYQEGS